ncbi:hypothetical protein EDC94DRAFT_589800 [Helicostylum pulchrum]|nr:hypothetical protein EDC94DRAFT_589800 [Helicostylum pulchrum]
MASSSRKTGESSTAVPITSISESESFYGFEFGTYAYNEIVRSIESSDINANKFVRQIFTACKNDPNPCSVTLGNLYYQALKLWEMNYPKLHNRWFDWVLSVPETTSYCLLSPLYLSLFRPPKKQLNNKE